MKPLALIVALVAFSSSAFAEGSYQNKHELRLVRDIAVAIDSGVADGCLSNPNVLKSEAEQVLLRLGVNKIPVSLMPWTHQLVINPEGFELTKRGEPTGICVAHLSVTLWRSGKVPEGHWGMIIAYKMSFLLAGFSKVEMQEELRDSVSQIVSDLANEILKARGQ